MIETQSDDESRSRPDGSVRPKRIPLDTDRIVEAAVGFIDGHDLRELTMRRLGATLGVEAMALYRYVPSRDDLLDMIVDAITDEIDADPDVLPEPEHGWQDYLQRLAHGVRKVALAHPTAFPLVASRPPAAPWLRPPLRSLKWIESFLSAMIKEGFSGVGAVAAYRAFTSFLLGHLLLEVASRGVEIAPINEDNVRDQEQSLEDYPNVKALRAELAENQSLVEFEESLENLLERLALLLHQPD